MDRTALDLAKLPEDPFERFRAIFKEAQAAIPVDPNAMTVATVGPDGQPAARILLLKEVDARGFVFYTNRLSRKGRELTATPKVALCFWWQVLECQVRVEGPTELMSDAESDAYFASRPRGSQLGAWASHQSEVLTGREVLEARLAEVTRRYEGRDVPRPPHWGGYRVLPRRIEFWHARPSRLHERREYTRADERAPWAWATLSP